MKALPFVPCLLITTTVASAAVVGHWRFESCSFLSDSSGNGNTLTSSGTVSQTVIPDMGNGSAFPNPVPQTGTTNGTMTGFGGSSAAGFDAADSTSINQISAKGTFTLEAFVNAGTGTTASGDADARYIVGQYNSSASARSFSFQMNTQNGMSVFLGRDDLAFAGTLKSSNSFFENNKDYYVAVSYDVGANTGTFYWQNLTDSGTLQSEAANFTAGGSGYNGTLGNPNIDLTVGYRQDSNKFWQNNGFLDEVRVSDTVLGESDLLVSIPEPSSLVLILVGASCWVLVCRKRR